MATETASTGRDSDKFMLRFPDGMRSRIKQAAEENGRTMNAEVVARLQGSFDHPPAQPGLPPGVLKELERLLDEKLGQRAYIDSAEGGRMQDVKPIKRPKA